MADTDAAPTSWNGDAARSAARDDDAGWNGGRSPSPRGATTPPRRERERSRSPVRRNEDRPDRSGGDNNPGNNLHVSGLGNRITDRDLEEAFGKFGTIQKAQVMYDPHSREPRGFAFVTFDKVNDAEAAMAAMNGTEIMGRRITIDKARRGRARTPTPGQYFGPPKKGGQDRRFDDRYGPPMRGGNGGGGGGGGYPPAYPMRGGGDPYDRYGPPPGRPFSPPMRGGGDPYDRYGRGPLPVREYPPRDRDYLPPPPPRAMGDYPPPRDFPPRGPPADYPPPRGYRDLSPPPARGRYEDLPPPPPRGGRYGDMPPRGGGGRYDDMPPRRY